MAAETWNAHRGSPKKAWAPAEFMRIAKLRAKAAPKPKRKPKPGARDPLFSRLDAHPGGRSRR